MVGSRLVVLDQRNLSEGRMSYVDLESTGFQSLTLHGKDSSKALTWSYADVAETLVDNLQLCSINALPKNKFLFMELKGTCRIVMLDAGFSY
jgi:hypothetical protein